jgi:hypothetical protein
MSAGLYFVLKYFHSSLSYISLRAKPLYDTVFFGSFDDVITEFEYI